MGEINNELGINSEENKKRQTFGSVQPKKKGGARKKVATAVVATAMVLAAIAVPTVIKLNSNKGYTVTLQYNMHGQLLGDNTSINLKKGSVVGDIQVPSKPGYVFVEFCSDAECTKSLSADTVISENLTIYLHYVAINYHLQLSQQSEIYGKYISAKTNNGDWQTVNDISLNYGDEITIRYNLTEQWNMVTDIDNQPGLEKIGETEVEESEHYSNYIVKYKVVGFGLTDEREANIELNFILNEKTFKVTFVSNGEIFTTATRTYGQYVDSTPIAIPSKEATISHVYTFVGWSTDENADPDDPFGESMVDLSTTQVTANTTYYAIYRGRARKYNLTLNDAVPPECVIISMNQGGTWTDVGHPSTLAYGTELVVIYKAQEGYSITESEIASGLEDTKKVAIIDGVSYPVYKVVGDVSIVYSQEINSYTVGAISSGVTVKHNGERVTTGAKLNYGSVVEISYELNPGHSLTSFEVTGALEQEDGTFKVTGVLKVTLKQAINTYTVTFNDYNGTLIKTQTVDWGASASITAPTRPADSTYTYAFAGWVDSEGNPVSLKSVKDNLTVYASYTPIYINYTLSINTNIATNGTLTVTDAEGNTLTNGSKIHNGDVLHISFVESDGHTGALTTTGLTENADGSYTINGDAGVTYAEEINTYTVTFLDYNGNKLGEQTVNWGTGASIADPTREGNKTYTYTFANWVTEKGGETEAELSNITANTTVYARYTEEYVKYNISIPSGVSVKRGEEPVTAETELHYNDTLTITYTEDEGYELDELKVLGAEKNGGVYTLTDNITITYTQKLKEYTLTTTGTSGTLTIKDEANNTYTNGSKVKHFTTLTVEYTPREGYHTSNLTVNGKEITSGSTITVTGTTSIAYAEEINTYTVTFKDYDGTTLNAITVNHGESASISNPSREEDANYVYSFAGWVTEQDGTETANLTNITGNTTVYASYSATAIYHVRIPSGVTVKRGEENITSTTNLFAGDKLTITYTEDEGYEVDNFNVTGATKEGYVYTVTGHVAVTYTQKLKEYTLTTTGTSGTLTITDEAGNTYTSGSKVKHFTKLTVEYIPTEGHSIKTLTVNGKDITSGSKVTVSGEVEVVYAETINAYTVTFLDYDGSLIAEKSVDWGESASIADPTREGNKTYTYTFAGWVTEQNGSQAADLTNITANTTVYARYKEEYVKYNISIPSGVSVKRGEEPVTADTELHYSDILTITYTEDEGYELDELKVLGAEENGGVYTLTDNITITYTQKLKEYTLTTTGTSGTLTITDEAGNTYTNGSKVKHFTTLTVEYTPREGYHTSNLTVNGKEIISGSTITVTGEVSIAYAEEINKYTVTYYDEDRTTVLHTTTVNYNGVVVYSETPTKEADNRYTYEFKSWTNAEGGTAVFTNIKADTSYYATYTATYIEYAVGEIPAGVEVYYLTGTSTQYSGVTKLSETSNIHYGDSVRFVYTSTEGHHYKEFRVDNLNVTKEETNRKTATIEGTIGGEIAIHCTEEIDTVTVTFLNYDGTNLGTQSVDWGTGVSFATPERVATNMYNYTFTGWVTEDGKLANLTQVTADITVKASFAENYQVYTLSLTNNMKAYYVSGTSEYTENEELTNKAGLHYGDKIRLEYTASEGNHITGVNITGATQDGDTETTATNANGEETAGYVVATVSRDVSASFTQAVDQYVLTWDSANVKVYKVTMLDTSGHSGSGRSAKLKSATLKSVDHNGGGDDSSVTTSSLTEIHSGDSVSYGDVIRVVYTASENYGKTEFNVTGLTITSSSTESEETGYIQGTVNNKPTITYAEENTSYVVTWSSGNVKVFKHSEDGVQSEAQYTIENDKDYAWTTNENGELVDGTNGNFGVMPDDGVSSTYIIKASSNINVSFDYKVYCEESDYCGLSISKGTTTLVSISGKTNYETLSVTLNAGEQLIISFRNSGDPFIEDIECAYIKNLKIESAETYKWKEIYSGEFIQKGDIIKVEYTANDGYGMTEISLNNGANIISSFTDDLEHGYVIADVIGNIGISYKEDYTAYLTYEEVADGYSVTGLSKKGKGLTTINIPESYNGKKIVGVSSNAFKANNIITSISLPNGIVTLGDSAFSECTNLSNIAIISSLTSIGNSAFNGCSSLTSITLPNSLTTIGSYAFSNCTKLTSVKYGGMLSDWFGISFGNVWGPSSWDLYINETKQTSLTIPDSVTSIGKYSFYNCSSLTSVVLPEHVITVGDSSFYNCKNLTSVTMSSSVTSVGSSAFYGCAKLTSVKYSGDLTEWCNINFVRSWINSSWSLYIKGTKQTALTIPEGVTSVGKYSFYHCTGLTSISISNTVTTVGDSAFSGCSNVRSIVIGEGVTDVKSFAFGGTLDGEGLSALTKIDFNAIDCKINREFDGAGQSASGITLTFGNKVQTIPELLNTAGTNSSLPKVTSVIISASVTTIKGNPFDRCPYLTSIKVDADNTIFTSRNNSGTEINGLINKSTKTLIKGANTTNFVIPEGITTIGAKAFGYCEKLRSVYIPSSVTTITASSYYYSPFYSCSSTLVISCAASSKPSGWSDNWNYYSSGKTLTVKWGQSLSYNVSISSNNTSYGTVSTSSLSVPEGTKVTVNGNKLTINGTTITATPKASTSSYIYEFSGWSVSNGATITNATTITATFTRVSACALTIANGSGSSAGSVSDSSLIIPKGSTLTVNGNKITVNGQTITATPAASTAEFEYSFYEWRLGDETLTGTTTINSATTITAYFARKTRTYNLTFVSNNSNYGKVNTSSMDVPYGAVLKADGNKIEYTSNNVTITFYASPAEATAEYTYIFTGWSFGDSLTVTGEQTITANFERTTNNYTVTIASNNTSYGTVSSSSISVPYGSTISVSGNTVTINDNTITATAATNTSQYTYAFSSWSNTSGTITGARTITANFTRTEISNTREITIKSNNTSYGTVSLSSLSVPNGSTVSVSGNKITINGTTITATAQSSTSTYTYSFDGWSVSNGDKITADTTITANFTRTKNNTSSSGKTYTGQTPEFMVEELGSSPYAIDIDNVAVLRYAYNSGRMQCIIINNTTSNMHVRIAIMMNNEVYRTYEYDIEAGKSASVAVPITNTNATYHIVVIAQT